tara:strand:- start:488 stop:760 length:273 start_codon:yes stop_codon:yes gene_type:complete
MTSLIFYVLGGKDLRTNFCQKTADRDSKDYLFVKFANAKINELLLPHQWRKSLSTRHASKAFTYVAAKSRVLVFDSQTGGRTSALKFWGL